MFEITEDYDPDLLYFIKHNKKVTKEEIDRKFPKTEWINLTWQLDDNLNHLIDIGKVKLKDGYYYFIKD
ncbi:hypothetical protein [Clostridium cadaveris]|uniref:hypothetical protein n=1 Tax=Clostridium cadaveris TaxID=1529 RepID=UPI001E57F8AA|nr:hypothetical protein [Clostridium cadaveris]UFH66442.1 hypothetical protein KQH81_07945 [Clostridium cadaveris]